MSRENNQGMEPLAVRKDLQPVRALALVWLCLLFNSVCFATDVQFHLDQAPFFLSPSTNREVILTPQFGDPHVYFSDTNSQCWASNLLAGTWSGRVLGPPSIVNFAILVTANNLGGIQATNIFAAAASATFPPETVAWAASVSDLRYALISQVDTNGGLLLSGTNTWTGPDNFTGGLFVNGNPVSTNSSSNTGGTPAAAGSNMLIYAVSGTNIFNAIAQPPSVNLTNLSGIATNLLAYISQLGTAAYSNSISFQPSSANLTNLSGVASNLLAYASQLGTAAYSNSASFQPANANLTNLTGIATNLLAYISQLGTAGYSNSASFQPASANLTSFSGVASNLVAYISQLGTAGYSNSISFQPASANLTNFTGIATNLLAYLSQLGTAGYSNSISFQPANASLTNFVNLAMTAAAITWLNQFSDATHNGILNSNDWASFNAKSTLNGNLSNWSTVATNLVAYLTQLGTAAYSNSASFQPANSTLTNYTGIATNLLAYLTQLGTAAYSNSISFQPANSNLTNFTGIATNLLAYLTQLGTAAYSNSISFQPANSVLTNWTGVATNLVAYLTQLDPRWFQNAAGNLILSSNQNFTNLNLYVSNNLAIIDANTNTRISLTPSATVIRDQNGKELFNATGAGLNLRDQNGHTRFYWNGGVSGIQDINGAASFIADGTSAILLDAATGSNAVVANLPNTWFYSTNVTATNQTAAFPSSLMTRSLGDARWLQNANLGTASYSNSISFAPAFTNGTILYVDPLGIAGTAKRGSSQNPYATIGAAVTAALAGDTVLILPGRYTLAAGSGPNLIPTNGAVYISPGTWITNQLNFYSASGGPAFTLSDNCAFLNDGAIIDGYLGVNNGIAQAAVGISLASSSAGGFTNVTLRPGRIIGDQDCILFNAPNPCSGVMRDAQLISRQTCLAFTNSTPGNWDIYNSALWSQGTNKVSSTNVQCLMAAATNSVIRMFGGSLLAGGAVVPYDLSQIGAGSFITLSGVECLTIPNAGSPAKILLNQSSATLRINACNLSDPDINVLAGTLVHEPLNPNLNNGRGTNTWLTAPTFYDSAGHTVYSVDTNGNSFIYDDATGVRFGSLPASTVLASGGLLVPWEPLLILNTNGIAEHTAHSNIFDGLIIGNGSGLTNLPTTALSAGTAANAQLLTFNGSSWVASNAPPSSPASITLSLSGTNAAVNAGQGVALGSVFTLTCTTNVLIQNPTGMIDKQMIVFQIIQDATGSRQVYFDSAFHFGSDLTGYTPSSTAGKRDFVKCMYDATAGFWFVQGIVRGY